MNATSVRKRSLSVGLASALCLFVFGVPISQIRAETVPNIQGGNEQREPGGTRGNDCTAGEAPLTALLPGTSTPGLTTAASPTFFFYLPENSAEGAEFVLYDEKSEAIYEKQVTVPTTEGVVSISIPTDPEVPELKVESNYYWTFALVCDYDDRATDEYVQGQIQRVELSPDLTTEIENATVRDRVALYADAGIWYDTLTTLAQLRRENPTDPLLERNWVDLLQSVGLDKIAREPLL
jgi:hypothetical protein